MYCGSIIGPECKCPWGSMSNLRAVLVLAITTWAFMVCFAVWLMFGVIGIPIQDELGLNGLQFGILTSTPILT
jgi:NNP family nitrate/nitrite transporter-like MFS transporter